jgi:hypothetical protein
MAGSKKRKEVIGPNFGEPAHALGVDAWIPFRRSKLRIFSLTAVTVKASPPPILLKSSLPVIYEGHLMDKRIVAARPFSRPPYTIQRRAQDLVASWLHSPRNTFDKKPWNHVGDVLEFP